MEIPSFSFRKSDRYGIRFVDAMPLMAMLSIKNQKALARGSFEEYLRSKRLTDSENTALMILKQEGVW